MERVWEHLNATGRTIIGQSRSLGASLDYARESFTMDDAYIEAVMRFFVHLSERGWIYATCSGRAIRVVLTRDVRAPVTGDLQGDVQARPATAEDRVEPRLQVAQALQ